MTFSDEFELETVVKETIHVDFQPISNGLRGFIQSVNIFNGAENMTFQVAKVYL